MLSLSDLGFNSSPLWSPLRLATSDDILLQQESLYNLVTAGTYHVIWTSKPDREVFQE